MHESGVYSTMFDETTNVSHTSQLSLVLRYALKNTVREDFVQFIDSRRDSDAVDANVTEASEPILTGKVLVERVLKMLNGLELNIGKRVGIAQQIASASLCQSYMLCRVRN